MPSTAESDWLAWQVLDQRRRFERLAPLAARLHPACVETDPARDERLAETLRAEAVTPAFEAARSSAPGRAGEAARREWRAACGPYLAAASAPADREIATIEARAPASAAGFPHRLEQSRDPERRLAVWREWSDLEARLERPRLDRLAACEQAAREAGAAALTELSAALHPLPPGATCVEFEAGAIAPLDDAVEAAARERYGPPAGDDPERTALLPLPGLFSDRADRFGAAQVRRVVEALSSRLPAGRTGGRPPILPAEIRPSTGAGFALATPEGALVLPGWSGPGGLRDALASLGACHRGAFLGGGGNPAAVLLSDPAFAAAVRVLFRRLLLSRAFLDWSGVDFGPGFSGQLRLEEAVATREAWSYLYLASTSGEPEPTEVERVFRRGSGRPPDPGRRARVFDRDLSGAAILRGTVLALLIEERLLSRYGWRWFLERSAGAWLAECWEAEAGETAESMSEQWDLGTMEPTPIVDRCRP